MILAIIRGRMEKRGEEWEEGDTGQGRETREKGRESICEWKKKENGR